MYFQNGMEAKVILTIEKKIANPRSCLTVTMCLYLKPNGRARSLSTLIAVNVSKDTAENIVKQTVPMAAA